MPIAALLLLLPAATPPDCGYGETYGLLLPEPGAIAAPAGAVVWSHQGSTEARLVDVSAAPWAIVDADITAPAPELVRYAPRAPLVDGHAYELREGQDVLRADSSMSYGGFAVSATASVAMPLAPVVASTGAPSGAGPCILAGLEVTLADPPSLALIRRGGVFVGFSSQGVLSLEGDAGALVSGEIVAVDVLDRRSAATAVSGRALAKTWADSQGCGGFIGCACAAVDGAAGGVWAVALVLGLTLRARLGRRRVGMVGRCEDSSPRSC